MSYEEFQAERQVLSDIKRNYACELAFARIGFEIDPLTLDRMANDINNRQQYLREVRRRELKRRRGQ